MTANRYTYPEAAEKLRVKERWLRRNIKGLPHSKKGEVVTFSDADLDAIDAMFHHTPVTGPLAIAAAPSAGAHPLAHLKPLPGRSSLRRA
ncbi:helix-turn-helix domain-containing protein [Streptomyces sp. NPDC053079]|uniref:helix-turn-helix domain-containing protein n=1 Tax=Streptomyces sp. NPDC053079 TaxID=3365697 RepID=UPI0037D78416